MLKLIVVALAVSVLLLGATTTAAAQTLYVDTSLSPTLEPLSNDCTQQKSPCTLVNKAVSLVGDYQTATIRFTSLAMLAAAGLVSLDTSHWALGPNKNISQFMQQSTVSWSRVNVIQPEEARQSFLHAQPSTGVVVMMPWQSNFLLKSDGYYYHDLGIQQVPEKTSASFIFESDPSLSSIVWPSAVSSGTPATLQDLKSLPGASTGASITLQWTQQCRSELVNSTVHTMSNTKPMLSKLNALFKLRSMTFRNLAIMDYMAFRSVEILNYYVTPNVIEYRPYPGVFAPQLGSSTTVTTMTNAVFLNVDQIYSNTMSFSTIVVTNVAAYNVSQQGIFGNPQSCTIDSIRYVAGQGSAFGALALTSTGLVVRNSKFINVSCTNIASSGTSVISVTGSALSMFNVTMIGSQCPQGAVLVNVDTATVQRSKFYRNAQSAIVIQPTSSPTINVAIANNEFVGNSYAGYDPSKSSANVQGGGAVRADWLGNYQVFLNNNIFVDNMAYGDGGAVFIGSCLLCTIILDGSIFIGNTARDNGGSISGQNMVRGTLSLNQVTILSSTALQGYGGGVYALSADGVWFDDFSCANCSAPQGAGGAMAFEKSQFRTYGASFAGCSARYGGTLYSKRSNSDTCYLKYVNGSTASEKGGFLAVEGTSTLYFRPIYGTSSITDVTAEYGAFASLSGDGVTVFENMQISRANARTGGSLVVVDSDSPLPWIVSHDPKFLTTDDFSLRNYDIFNYRYLRMSTLSMVDSGAPSGELFLCKEKSCSSQFAELSLSILNTTSLATKDRMLSATDPRSVRVVQMVSADGKSIPFTQGSVASGISVKLKPGDVFSLVVAAYDQFDHKISIFKDLLVTLQMVDAKSGGAQVIPSTSITGIDDTGFVRFVGLQVIGTPNAHVDMMLSFSTYAKEQVSSTISIELDMCNIGYVPVNGQCSLCCGPDFYSATANATSCDKCPTNARCSDGNHIEAEPGYYLVQDGTVKNATIVVAADLAVMNGTSADSLSTVQRFVSVECPNNYCLGSNNCSNNRYGLLCGTCKPGTAEWNGACVSCKQGESNGWLIFAWLIYLT